MAYAGSWAKPESPGASCGALGRPVDAVRRQEDDDRPEERDAPLDPSCCFLHHGGVAGRRERSPGAALRSRPGPGIRPSEACGRSGSRATTRPVEVALHSGHTQRSRASAGTCMLAMRTQAISCPCYLSAADHPHVCAEERPPASATTMIASLPKVR